MFIVMHYNGVLRSEGHLFQGIDDIKKELCEFKGWLYQECFLLLQNQSVVLNLIQQWRLNVF